MTAANCCDHCGKPWVKQGNMLLCPGDGTRHPKWQQVSPGTVIPAGQPYRIEWHDDDLRYGTDYKPNDHDFTIRESRAKAWFIDSSWKPPLVLPTEPTWGIAVFAGPHPNAGLWRADEDGKLRKKAVTNDTWQGYVEPLDFIPLTDEQVARIEAAR